MLYAAAPAWRDTAALVACALTLLLIALCPPALCVSSAIVCARIAESGGVRALNAHGACRSQIVGMLRLPAVLSMLLVSSVGVACEPALAARARDAVTALGARGLAGSLAHGGQVEPLDGVVMAAPAGRDGPIYIAKISERQAFLRAERFSLRPERGVQLALRDVSIRSAPSVVRASRVEWTMAPPAPDESLLAGELMVPVTTREVRPLRRHAARALWGVMAFVAVMLSASLALRASGEDPWRVARASVATLAVIGISTRAGWAVLEAMRSVGAVRAATVAVALAAVGLTEWAVRRR